MVAEEEKFPFQGSLCNSNKKKSFINDSIFIVQGKRGGRLKYRQRNGYFLKQTLKINKT